VFKPTTIEEYNFQKESKNATSVIKMFQIKTQANADVYLDHNNVKIHTKRLTMVILNLRSIRSIHNLRLD
jgi:hypothetical protein